MTGQFALLPFKSISNSERAGRCVKSMNKACEFIRDFKAPLFAGICGSEKKEVQETISMLSTYLGVEICFYIEIIIYA